jgi:peptide deformylase
MHIVVPDEYKFLYEPGRDSVVKIPAPVLRQHAIEIQKISRKTQFLIDDMMRILRRANGVGLAAPQVGVLQRMVVIAPEGFRPTALLNPRVIKAEGEQIGQEGCLSIPGLYGDVKRAEYVEVEAMDRKGREMVFELEGMPARVAQHEIDHLDGVLFIDKVDAATLHWMIPDGAVAPVREGVR